MTNGKGTANDDEPSSQWARKSISLGEKVFENVKLVVDPNTNDNTENQKSIDIATEFLKNASPDFLHQQMSAKNKDRLVKVGRSLVDLVAMADEDSSENSEKFLKLGLANIKEQCDILARDDLEVRVTFVLHKYRRKSRPNLRPFNFCIWFFRCNVVGTQS